MAGEVVARSALAAWLEEEEAGVTDAPASAGEVPVVGVHRCEVCGAVLPDHHGWCIWSPAHAAGGKDRLVPLRVVDYRCQLIGVRLPHGAPIVACPMCGEPAAEEPSSGVGEVPRVKWVHVVFCGREKLEICCWRLGMRERRRLAKAATVLAGNGSR